MRQSRVTRNYKKASALVALSFLVVYFCGACTHIKEALGLQAQRPRVTLVDLSVKRADLQSIEVIVGLQIYNPNDFALKFTKLRYSLKVEEDQVASGSRDEKVEVGPEARETVRLPMTLNTKNAFKIMTRLLNEPKDLMAVFEASAIFDSPVGPMDVGLNEKKPLRTILNR